VLGVGQNVPKYWKLVVLASTPPQLLLLDAFDDFATQTSLPHGMSTACHFQNDTCALQRLKKAGGRVEVGNIWGHMSGDRCPPPPLSPPPLLLSHPIPLLNNKRE